MCWLSTPLCIQRISRTAWWRNAAASQDIRTQSDALASSGNHPASRSEGAPGTSLQLSPLLQRKTSGAGYCARHPRVGQQEARWQSHRLRYPIRQPPGARQPRCLGRGRLQADGVASPDRCRGAEPHRVVELRPTPYPLWIVLASGRRVRSRGDGPGGREMASRLEFLATGCGHERADGSLCRGLLG